MSKFRALGSAIWGVWQDTFAEQVKVRQGNMTAAWGSARSKLSKFLAFREIIFRKMPMSVILPPAILGLEMDAPIYGLLGFLASFCWKNPMPIKLLVLGEGEWLFWTGWKRQFYFYGRIFSFPEQLVGGPGVFSECS